MTNGYPASRFLPGVSPDDSPGPGNPGFVRVSGSWQPIPRVDFNPGPAYANSNRHFGIASSIARTPGGRLVCGFCSGGTEECHLNYDIIIFSQDDGNTWSPPAIVLDTDGDGPIRSDHPTLWTAPNGTLWLMWSQYPNGLCGPHSSLWAITCSRPDADELLWSPPRRLVDEQNLLTTPTVLSDGTWIFPTGCWDRRLHPSRPLISRDGGATFTLGGPLLADTNPDYDEYMVVERADRSLVAFNRHHDWFLQCESRDGGQTWTKQQTNNRPHVHTRFVFMKLQSGAWLLVKHGPMAYTMDAAGQRQPKLDRIDLRAYLSHDEGATWAGGLVLDERGCSYPYGMQAGDGTIYVSYERSRWWKPEILVARFTEADVAAGQLVSPRSALKLLANRAHGGAKPPADGSK